MKRLGYTLTILVGASLGVAACTDPLETTPPPADTTPPPGGTTTGSDGNTFDHENNSVSIWDLIDRMTKEGPPSFSSQMHGCTKPRYATLGNILSSIGVNTASTTALSAGLLYTGGGPALGAPNYGARVRENLSVTTSGASRQDDIFAAAATEVIANVGTLARCNVGSTPAVLFDAQNQCHAEGITCIIGTPATLDHVALCNETVTRASTPDIGKRLAVAALLAAAYTCE
jgi:hypothetical protein